MALSTCLAPGLVAASPSDEPMPPAESSAPRSAGGPNEGPMPPAESDGYRTAASAPERALPPSESAGYRSAKTKPEPAMPPGETPRRARRRARLPAWMTAVAPRDLDVETSLLVGAFLPAYAHELYDPYSGWRPLARGAVELGARIDYFPVRWLGFEVEGLGIPTRVRGAGSIAVGAVRGGVVLRLPWRIAPLISGGLGALGVSSSSGELGDDVDPAYHVGLGVQAFATRWLIVRLDGRDVLSHRRGVGGGPVHHGELVLAVGARFGPRRGPADARAPARPTPTTMACRPSSIVAHASAVRSPTAARSSIATPTACTTIATAAPIYPGSRPTAAPPPSTTTATASPAAPIAVRYRSVMRPTAVPRAGRAHPPKTPRATSTGMR
ncbi:MAG: hypothetical protein IPN32_31805 [Deltaproteobacteria bacterium]|nr:hypothetical protein [Deltaproteobacteria bacterium]